MQMRAVMLIIPIIGKPDTSKDTLLNLQYWFQGFMDLIGCERKVFNGEHQIAFSICKKPSFRKILESSNNQYPIWSNYMAN